MKKQHAIHNENVCEFLLDDGRFYDWVITTAFYSALHYVNHEVFPFEEDGITFHNLNHYHRHLRSTKTGAPSKHLTTIALVSNHLSHCLSYYRWLYDKCMTARYTNYQLSYSTASKAKNYLNSLKSHLNK